jgi:uncharacterized RDD family membrane protein YckC
LSGGREGHVAGLERESILGLDNIRLDLPIAGIGSRTLAAFLDYLGFSLVALLWILVCVSLIGPLLRSWSIAVLLLGIFALEWGYFAGLEIATRGRTLGKMALRLRVVTAVGATPGAGALMLRNLVRMVDLVAGAPLIALDPLARRLGDRLAGTLVVHDLPAARRALLLGRLPPGWGAREVAVAEAFLARESQLADPAARERMARGLLARVAHDAPDLVAGLDDRDPVAALRRALAVEED